LLLVPGDPGVDRLVRDTHPLVQQVVQFQSPGDLLGRPLPLNSLQDVRLQTSVVQQPGPTPIGRLATLIVSRLGPTRRVEPAGIAVPLQLPRDRAGSTCQQTTDSCLAYSAGQQPAINSRSERVRCPWAIVGVLVQGLWATTNNLPNKSRDGSFSTTLRVAGGAAEVLQLNSQRSRTSLTRCCVSNLNSQSLFEPATIETQPAVSFCPL
jgi:hypothetical protein